MKQKLLRSLRVPVITGFCFCFINHKTVAQSCIPTGLNGAVFNYVCPQTCSDLNFQVPHIKSTDNYTVSSIPHTPYPWVTAGGTELIELYADDLYSSVINLPFPFCFYGSVYNSCVVGSNGLITFDISNANTVNAWSLTTVPHGSTPQPIPYAGGSPNTTDDTYYPRAAIMGAYHDIFPLINAPQRRVEYSIVGTAPCRKFVVSFYVVPLYGSAVCNGRLCTQQMVLHENTGIIDMHLGDKPVCNAWNMGLAILGLQNWNRNAAVSAPGKNCTVWIETATSYRFTPSGSSSRFVRSELFTLSGTLVATADTVTTSPGILDVQFLNICPPPDTTRFEIRTTFSSCNNPAAQLINSDTITTILDNGLDATATSTNSNCTPSGTITVTVPPGTGTPPFTYVLDGGPPLVTGFSHTYTGVVHGPHTVVVTDANGECTSTINITVGRNNALVANTSATQTYCAGSASGTITATVLNGTGPYFYNLNGGGAFFTGGSPHTFTGLSAGTHTLVVTDATGCMTNTLTINITDGPGVSGNSSTTPTTCPTATNGTIRVTATAGMPPFTFSLDGGTPQSGSNPYTFTNVPAGPHTVLITDNVGCTFTLNPFVPPGPALTAANTAFATSCNGATDGRIRVTPQSGAAPYTYSLDGATPVPGAAPYTFNNVGSGVHTIQVFDATGCASVIYSVTVPPGPDLTSTATKTDVLCNGAATGTITVAQPGNGVPPFQYSINGAIWQAGRTFSGLTAGSYTVQFRSSDGCSGSLSVTINEPPALTSAIAMIPVICNGQNNGVINVTAGGGVPPYQYSINGGTTWQSSNIFNAAAGNYTIAIRDANNCITGRNVTMTEPAVLSASSGGNTNATCDGGNNGRITVTATGGNSNYQYALDGGSYQSSNIFNVAPGNYIVYVKDNLGCTTSFITSVGLTFNLFLNPMADPTICEGSSVQLQPSSNAAVYNWSPGTSLSNPNIASPTANPADTTWYYLTAILGRCTLWDTIRLNVNKAPIPDAGPDGDICYGQSYTLQGSGGTQYNWTPAIYLNGTSGANPVSTPTLNTIYTLSVIDNYGCRSLVTDDVKVTVKRVMAVHTFPFDTVAAPGETFPLLAVSPGITYRWTPATGLSNPNVPNPYVTVSSTIGDEMTYQVSAVNSDGCKGEGYVKIKIHKGPAIYVPNAFTPDGDGKNDRFTPFPVGIKAYNYFRVFNRWGQVIFSTKALHQGWDGRIGGMEQPTGTYVWMIEGITADNKLITKKGTVTLIR
ncbi:MAG: gliding motility-associated C-terminal domain-containing protein [Bacteroidota bacterium]